MNKDKKKTQGGFVTIAGAIALAVVGLLISSGTADFTGTSLKEKKLVVTAKPELLKTGLAEFIVNE